MLVNTYREYILLTISKMCVIMNSKLTLSGDANGIVSTADL